MNSDTSEKDIPQDKPKSVIEKRIFRLTLELHKDGHTRKEIVHYLRKVADDYEDYWEGKDSYDKTPSEKDVVLPGDIDDE